MVARCVPRQVPYEVCRLVPAEVCCNDGNCETSSSCSSCGVTTPDELPSQTYETQNPVEPEAESQTIETRKDPLPTPADADAGAERTGAGAAGHIHGRASVRTDGVRPDVFRWATPTPERSSRSRQTSGYVVRTWNSATLTNERTAADVGRSVFCL